MYIYLLLYWKQILCPLQITDELRIPEVFCSKDLDLDSDLQYLLPRRQGPGLCATGLVSHLVTLHNEMVNAADNHTKEESRYKIYTEIQKTSLLNCPTESRWRFFSLTDTEHTSYLKISFWK